MLTSKFSISRRKRPVTKRGDGASVDETSAAMKVANILGASKHRASSAVKDLDIPTADIFPTANGHRKVVTETSSSPFVDDNEDPNMGLRSIDVVARVVQKDMWTEESQALERRALESGNKRTRKRPVRKQEAGAKEAEEAKPRSLPVPASMGLRMAEATAGVEKPSLIGAALRNASKLSDGAAGDEGSKDEEDEEDEAVLLEESNVKETSILSDVSKMAPTVHDMNGLPFRNLNKNKGGIKDMTKSSRQLLEFTASRGASVAASAIGSPRMDRSHTTLAELLNVDQGDEGDLVTNAMAARGFLRDSRNAESGLDGSLGESATAKRLSAAAGALTGNALELHNMLQTATGGATKSTGPLSDDGGSSLKSLEYSQALNLTVQELAWQAQLATAAAAAADPEMTTAEIGRAPEYHVDFARDKKKVKDLMAAQTNQKWASAKSFIGKRAQELARQKKQREGWEPLSDTHEFRLAPNGVLEVRKKGMWDETEEQRQKRLAGQKTIAQRIRGTIASYMGWDKEIPRPVKHQKTAGEIRRELMEPVSFDLDKQIHLCEPMTGHQGVVRAMAEVKGKMCVGGTDGKVRVWRHWNEMADKRKKRKSMKKSLNRLKSLNLDLGESSMYKDIAEEASSDGAQTEAEEEEEPQTAEWEIMQVMDHNSAITAIIEITLKIKEHRLNEQMMAVSTRNGCLFLWSTADDEKWICAKEIRVASIILCMTFHEGRIMAGCDDGGLHAWRLSDMEHGIIEGHKAAIWSIAWVDEYLVSGSSDGNLKIWQHDEEDDSYDHIVSVTSDTGGIWSISNHTQIITATDDEMMHVIMQRDDIWDLVNTFEHGHRGPVTRQEVINVNYLVTCSPGRGAHIKGWNRKTWDCLWEIVEEVGPCWSMLHIGNSLIFGGSDPALTVFRCYIPEWLMVMLEQEHELENETALPDADVIFSSSVLGDEVTLESMSDSLQERLNRSHSREIRSALGSAQSSLPPAEKCESPQELLGKGVTRNLMLA